MQTRITLFDLDHTLIPFDSDHAWGDFAVRIGWGDSDEFKKINDQFYEDYKRGTLDIRAYVRFNTSTMRAHTPAERESARQRFLREVVRPAIAPAATALVAQHRARHDRIVIITATNEWLVEPIANLFNIDDLIAIRLERRDGEYTGEIEGVPSFRDGKVLRVRDWLRIHGFTREQVHIVFYTDSHNDLPLLEYADEPIASNPDDQLRITAAERGWRIIDLFSQR